MSTDDLVTRGRAVLQGVTEGPWEVDQRHRIIWLGDCDLGFRIGEHHQADENARFVAEARTLVPEMVAEIEALRAQLAAHNRHQGTRPPV